MKNDELLKHTYENYPKGTFVFWEIKSNKFKTTGEFEIQENEDCLKVIDSNGMDIYDSRWNYNSGWAEIISDKQLSILDNCSAIQVNNEREFSLLMSHYESNGWKWYRGQDALKFKIVKFPACITYEDSFCLTTIGSGMQFLDFAKELGVKVPKFIIESEDNVDLYEKDDYHAIKKVSFFPEKWDLCVKYGKLHSNDFVVTNPSNFKVFSSLEAAKAWIQDYNKPKTLPKEIVLYKNISNNYVIVRNDSLEFVDQKANTKTFFSRNEIVEIWEAYQSLQ